jgi:uncharacterized heparinase superfamily protein
LPATNRDSWRQVARATAAHSTATLNDASSARIVASSPVRRMLQGMPIVGGPRQVDVEREDTGDNIVLRVSHDGYADDFNTIHHRILTLAADGQKLDGEDIFSPAKGESLPTGRDQYAIRFHLHPSVKASRLTDSHGAMLVLPNKEVWSFNAYDDRVDLEESVYLAGSDGPRRAMQIVIYGRARKVPRVQWTFASVPSGSAPLRRAVRNNEPQLPL